MAQSTVATASPAMAGFEEFVAGLLPQLSALFAARQSSRQQPATPERTYAFEKRTDAILRETGRVFVEQQYNHVEPEQLADSPQRLRRAGQEYRRRPKSRNRIGTLFRAIELRRYLYEAAEPGERSLLPLELQLGIEAGLATPALAERVGLWSAEHEQEGVRTLLVQEHTVSWSVKSLRKVTASLRDGLASFREEAQVARLLELLAKAFASKGKHRPVLAAGRAGGDVAIRQDGYHEGATATVSVLDRRGRRLGRVYLGP